MKDKADTNCLEYVLCQSADCLDVIRPCCGWGGRSGYNSELLSFLREDLSVDPISFRKGLIEEAWEFIQITEDKKFDFNDNQGFTGKIFNILWVQRKKFPILSTLLNEGSPA